MSDLRVIWSRIRGLRHHHPAETELADELESHRAMLVDEGLRRGMTADQAARFARMTLGGEAAIRESVREESGISWLEDLWHDARFALRLMRKNPAFTLIAVMAIALGIGANTLMFSVVNNVLLQPLPYPGADRLALIRRVESKTSRLMATAVPDYYRLRDQNRSFASVAAFYQRPMNITGEDTPDRVQALFVSGNFFDALKMEPRLGRGFSLADEEWGSHRVVLLTDGLWKLRYGADPSVVGKVIHLNTEPYEVIGVLPPTAGSFAGVTVQLYTPMAFAPNDMMNSRGNHFLSVVARLKPNVTHAEADAELDAVMESIRRESPQEQGFRMRSVDLREAQVGNVKPVLWVLSGAVGFVLLIACANVANLLVARSAVRAREVVLRSALGARRGRLVRQFTVESTLLSLVGGSVGLALAAWGIRSVQLIGRRMLPRANEVHLDARVLLFTVVVVLVTGILFGLAPTFHSLRLNLNDLLKEASPSSDRSARRTRSVLVVAEVAISLVLLIGAGLMFKSMYRLLQIDPGFDPNHVIASFVNLPQQKYLDARLASAGDPQANAKAVQYFNEAFTRLRGLPGVVAVGGITNLPLTGEAWGKVLTLYDRPLPASVRDLPEMQYRVVAGDYFGTLRIHVTGRAFQDSDSALSEKVVVVNRELERRFFPGGTAIGKQLSINPPASLLPHELAAKASRAPDRFTIIGVADDVHYGSLQSPPPPLVYGLLSQAAEGAIGLQLVVRASGDPMQMLRPMREQLAQIDHDVPLASPQLLESVVANQTAQPRVELILLASFAALAVVLATIGIYGVISYTVVQRTREIGLRMALGAGRSHVVTMIVKYALVLVTVGLAVGLAAAAGLTRLLRQMLFGVSTTDPVVFVSITAGLAAIAVVASLLPAMRATRVDPMVTLREP